MAEKKGPTVFTQKRWWSGLSNYPKEDLQNSFYFAQSIDYRTDAQALTLLPAALKESGSVVSDLLKWADTTPESLDVYLYGDAGNIYKRTTAGAWSLLHTAASSHGNGLAYFYGDDYLYYTTDSTLGRYGPINGSSPQFSDDFLRAQGGVPTNTASVLLASASSQYATAADSASLSITGNLTLETFFKANTLPTVGNSMTLLGKWDESTNRRSYKLDLLGVSGYFGDGSSGSLTISVNTTDAPIDSACSGTSGTQTLAATNASFAVGQVIFIHQTQGTNAGQWERNTIQGYTAGTITLQTPLIGTYVSGAQVLVLKQYTSVTVNTGITWSAKAWNGTTGGILLFLANGTVTINGTISADALGFRGGNGSSTSSQAYCGEGTGGPSILTTAANGNGGGGAGLGNAAGGGGGNGAAGQTGTRGGPSDVLGAGGLAAGANDLTNMVFGGGGGGATGSGTAHNGLNGGGIIFITGATFTMGVSGLLTASSGTQIRGLEGAGGAGGSILIKTQNATLGTNQITAMPSFDAVVGYGNGQAGAGRVVVDYLTAYTGTTTPTLNPIQDQTLVTTTTMQARLGISNDGTAVEYLTQNLPSLTTGTWNRLSVAWTAASSTATFYLNAVSLGTSTGTKTSINDNVALLYVGANKTSVIANFFDGYLNDMRIFNNVQTAGQIYANNLTQIAVNTSGLQAYYKFNSVYTDGTGNANNLTAVNSPTFSSSVPFPNPTTRLDIDQQYTTTGSTYAIPTSISESSADMLTFTPLLDPQKSVDFNIAAKGTGSFTITVHDAQNTVIATQTTASATLPASGYYEFIFTTPWRININKTYHFHVTSTVADGTLVSSSSNNLQTADFHTYYGFLVNDTNFHPIARMLNKTIIGNERYLATWDGASYNANFIAFPPQTHVRCFGFWRDYIAVGTWQEPLNGSANIYDWSTGRIYFWDGIALTFNFWIDVAEGQVNALYGIDTNLYIVAGWNGHLLLYQGGYINASGNSVSSKIKKFPFLESTAYMEVYPQGMALWRSLLHMGFAANSNSEALPRGVYSWGTINNMYPESLSYDYPLSTGNTGSTVSIGLVYPAGQTLLIGWQDGIAFGCDQVNFLNNRPASYGTIQTLIQDGNDIWHEDQLMKVRADHFTLLTGESITVKYKINRETTWESAYSITDTSGTFTTNAVSDGRSQEFQLAVDMFSTNGTSPTLLGISALSDPLGDEEQF